MTNINSDFLIVGAGVSGATVARILAENNFKVTVVEKRPNIAGNTFDYYDNNGILVQKYGPHIFHTNEKLVFDFLSRFTDWFSYKHKVLALVDGTLVPVPFNLTSLETLFDSDTAKSIKEILINEFGYGQKLPILKLIDHENQAVRDFAKFVYEKIFKFYTQKQWGLKPEDMDGLVTARVPVYISYEDNYFTDEYQFQPKNGFTSLIENMLNHDNITVKLSVDALKFISIDDEQILLDGKPFNGQVVYTGQLDELFNYKFGKLPYRSLEFDFKTLPVSSYQKSAVINYTTSENYTRISEFTKFTCPKKDNTVIVYEYSKNCEENDIPYYPVLTENGKNAYIRYARLAKNIKNLHLLGRLADYKYYNIDSAVLNALKLAQNLCKG